MSGGTGSCQLAFCTDQQRLFHPVSNTNLINIDRTHLQFCIYILIEAGGSLLSNRKTSPEVSFYYVLSKVIC